MSQINLNPVTQATRVALPTAVTSGMSTVAKVITTLATLFFATFIYIAFFGSKGGSRSSCARREELNEQQQKEIAQIQQVLGTFFDSAPTSKHSAEYNRLYAKFTGNCKVITPSDILEAQALISRLQGPPSETPEQRRIREFREEREEQDRNYEEALQMDQMAKIQEERVAEMTEALTFLQADLSRAIEELDARYDSLQNLETRWARICGIARFSPPEPFTKIFNDLERRFELGKHLDLSVPVDHYQEAVEVFYDRFPDVGETFDHKRKALDESYRGYLEAIEQVQERLSWERLKTYHAEVGEEFFRSQLPQGLLTEVRRGEDLPRP